MKTKVCSKCGVEKGVDCFPKNKRKKDGIGAWCRVCMNKYVAKRRSVKKLTGHYPVIRQPKIEIEKKCITCGNLFKTTISLNSEYCSKKCWYKRNKDRIHKTCSTCGKSMPIEMFAVRPRSIDGHRSSCKACEADSVALYRSNDPEKIKRARKRKYWEDHETSKRKGRNNYIKYRNRILKQAKEYRENNKDTILEKARAWRAENRDIGLQCQRRYRENNRDKTKAYGDKWRAENKQHMIEYGRIYLSKPENKNRAHRLAAEKRERLADSYMKNVILNSSNILSTNDYDEYIDDEYIELRRQNLLLKRELNNLRSEENEETSQGRA